MADLMIKSPSPARLAAMADGLLRAGDYALAAQLYRRALKGLGPAEGLQARVRLSLATSPTNRTSAHVEALEAIERFGHQVYVGEGIATWFKTLPFLEDERFMALAERHAHLATVAGWHWNLQIALWAASEALRVEGDFLELGVFRGHTSRFLIDYLDFASVPRTWLLYDTFDGIPADQLEPGWEDSNVHLYRATFSFDEVAKRFRDVPNARVIKGRVPEILSTDQPKAIAFLHLDLNNPTAEIAALDLLFDRISPGGVILLDDYGWAKARPQYEAENAWFLARDIRILHLPTGQGLIVKH